MEIDTSQVSGRWAGVRGRWRMKRAILVMGLAGVVGCATTVWWGSPSNMKSTTLSLGMSTQQAQALLGPPQHMVSQEVNGIMVETWNYVDRTLIFQNGILRSWQADSGGQEGGTSQ